MDTKRASVALSLFVIGMALLWIAFVYALPEKSVGTDVPHTTEPADEGTIAEVILMHTIGANNVHAYAGSVVLPDPCHELGASVSATYGTATKATIALTSKREADAICAQVLTEYPFSVEVMSKQAPEVEVWVDGKKAPVSTVEKE